MRKLEEETETVILGNCKTIFVDSEKSISEIINNSTAELKNTVKATKWMMAKNLIYSFATTIVLLAGAIGGCLYIQNYKDGTKIAEAKAVEALAEERAKLEKELIAKKKEIELDAISIYKESDGYREDACKLVASNITKLDYLHYMYIYIKSDDIKQYKGIKDFYNNFLTEGHKQYKKIYSK